MNGFQFKNPTYKKLLTFSNLSSPQNVAITTTAQTEMSAKPQKTCFVTIGATASFGALIKAVLSPGFCAALEAHSYTDLLVQYGQDGKNIHEQCLQQLNAAENLRLRISGFDLDMAGLGRRMRQAKGVGITGASEGVVISHAGMVNSTLYQVTTI